MTVRAVKSWRWPDNPLEKAFHDAWQKESGLLRWMLGDGATQGEPTPKEEMTAAIVIQWRGSSVGQHFLANVLKEEGLDALKSRVEKRR